VEGSCGHGNEPSGSIKCWEVLEWLIMGVIIISLIISVRIPRIIFRILNFEFIIFL
jgi:hypothetical protein